MCSEFFLVECRKNVRLHAAEVDSRISRRVAIVAGGGPSATKQFRKAFCCSKWRWHCPAQQGCNCTSIYIFLMQSLIMSVLCFVIVWPVCILLYIWAGMGRGNQVIIIVTDWWALTETVGQAGALRQPTSSTASSFGAAAVSSSIPDSKVCVGLLSCVLSSSLLNAEKLSDYMQEGSRGG